MGNERTQIEYVPCVTIIRRQQYLFLHDSVIRSVNLLHARVLDSSQFQSVECLPVHSKQPTISGQSMMRKEANY